ncbi:MAG: hypothetical protein WD070_03065, partial [Pirellulaceae bacterium]
MKRAALSLAMLLVSATSPTSAADADAEGVRFFETKIRPVLIEHCYECHSGKAAASKSLKGQLQVDTRGGIRAGG